MYSRMHYLLYVLCEKRRSKVIYARYYLLYALHGSLCIDDRTTAKILHASWFPGFVSVSSWIRIVCILHAVLATNEQILF